MSGVESSIDRAPASHSRRPSLGTQLPSLQDAPHTQPDGQALEERGVVPSVETAISNANPDERAASAKPNPVPLASSEQLRDLHNSSQLFLHRIQSLVSLRDELLTLRNQAKFELERWRGNRTFVDESRSRLFQAAEKALVTLDQDGSGDELRKAYALAVDDYDREANLAMRVVDLESRLSNHESGMQNAERALDTSARSMRRLLVQMTLLDDEDPAASSRAATTSRSSPEHRATRIHPLVQHYLDKVGDLKLLRERLFDLDQEHMQQKGFREFLQDQELELEVPEKKFDAHWVDVFAEAELAYAEAKKKTKLARRVCESEGLELRLNSKNSSTSQDYESERHSDLASVNAATERSEGDGISASQQPPYAITLAADDTFREGNWPDSVEHHQSNSGREQPKAMTRDAWVADWVDSTQKEPFDGPPGPNSDLASQHTPIMGDAYKQAILGDPTETSRTSWPPWLRMSTVRRRSALPYDYERSSSF